MRDAAADAYRAETGDVWRPRHGSHTSQTKHLTSAAIDARNFLRARNDRAMRAHLPEGTLVAITDGKDARDPAAVIRKLDQARAKHPNMVPVHGGGSGVEGIAAQCAVLTSPMEYTVYETVLLKEGSGAARMSQIVNRTEPRSAAGPSCPPSVWCFSPTPGDLTIRRLRALRSHRPSDSLLLSFRDIRCREHRWMPPPMCLRTHPHLRGDDS